MHLTGRTWLTRTEPDFAGGMCSTFVRIVYESGTPRPCFREMALYALCVFPLLNATGKWFYKATSTVVIKGPVCSDGLEKLTIKMDQDNYKRFFENPLLQWLIREDKENNMVIDND